MHCNHALTMAQVEVFEEKPIVGGACRTEYPFPKVPGLGHSTGAYLLGVMPPELIQVWVRVVLSKYVRTVGVGVTASPCWG